MNYTALDFETANSSRASICAVGFVRVESGRVVAQGHQLIRPDSRFDPRNVIVHSITEFDVRNAPRFSDYWEELRPLLCDNVVAHNAPFDIGCLRESLDLYGLASADFKYLCTLSLSRKILRLERHSLDYLARHLQLGEFRHHNALEDASMCSKLFEILCSKADVSKFSKPFSRPNLKSVGGGLRRENRVAEPVRGESENTIKKIDNIFDIPTESPQMGLPLNCGAEIKKAVRTPVQQDLFEMCSPLTAPQNPPKRGGRDTPSATNAPFGLESLDFDYSAIDFSKSFAVAGVFSNISRKDAEGLILKAGGRVDANVCSTTDYIVVGGETTRNLMRGEYGSQIDKALEYARAKFVSESHFLREI